MDKIKNEPLSKLNENYTILFIKKIKKLNEKFVINFYKYLDYDDNNFIINVNDIWNWLGFISKDNCIRIIKQFFIESTDYMVDFNSNILLNISAFKKLCIQSNTNEGDEIYKYYCELERCYREVLEEKIYDNYFYS